MMVQWLRLCPSPAGGTGSVPSQGSPCAVQCGKKRKNKSFFFFFFKRKNELVLLSEECISSSLPAVFCSVVV